MARSLEMCFSFFLFTDAFSTASSLSLLFAFPYNALHLG